MDNTTPRPPRSIPLRVVAARRKVELEYKEFGPVYGPELPPSWAAPAAPAIDWASWDAAAAKSGPPSNTALCTSAAQAATVAPAQGAALPAVVLRNPDAVPLVALHIGFDTVAWHYRLESPDELAALHLRFAPLVGLDEAELPGFGPCKVRQVGKNYLYAVDTGLGLRVSIPRDARYPVMVYSDPKFSLSCDSAELQGLAEGFAAVVLGLRPGSVALLLSRLDVACDIVVKRDDWADFAARLVAGDDQVVTRARQIAFYSNSGVINSVRVGKGDVVLRAYDKEDEAESGGDLAFWEALWGVSAVADDEQIVRFEWQLRGGYLRQIRCPEAATGKELLPAGVETLADFLACSGSILEYLGLAWFRLAELPEGKEKTRLTMAWWQGVVNAMRSTWYEFSPGLWRDTARKLCKDPELLSRMASGVLASLSAIYAALDERAEPLDGYETVDRLLAWLEQNADDWGDRAQRRFKKLRYSAEG